MSDSTVERMMRPRPSFCQHYACRCARAAELAAMSDRTGDPNLLAKAFDVHSQVVPCRQIGAALEDRKP